MPAIFSVITQVLGSSTFGVVLSLLLLFQWYKQHAKEQAVKNNLFAIRRKICRRIEDKSLTPETACDMVDDVDSILSTLGARKPFRETLDRALGLINLRNTFEEKGGLIGRREEVQPTSVQLTASSNKVLQKIKANPRSLYL